MERTDRLDKVFESADAQFLMVTAVTHTNHRFRVARLRDTEVRKLREKLAAIDAAVEQVVADLQSAR